MTHLHEQAPAEVAAAEPDEQTAVPLKIEDWLTVIVMGLLSLITFANVLVRYFTDQSFAWTEEFSVFLMIVLALVAGLLFINSIQNEDRARELAEVDVALLTDELPPAAFSDPGFLQFLKTDL